MATYFSIHARERMMARGISKQDVLDAVRRGSKALQNPDKILSYYQYFCVVYRKKGDDIFIITVKPR